MKVRNLFVGALVILLLYGVLIHRVEGFKNIDNEAVNELVKIREKILPHRAICVNGTQCMSGRCLETNNETTYGYCDKPRT